MKHNDRMDILVAAAVRQGFRVWQTRTGAWVFQTGGTTVSHRETPRSGREWVTLLGSLRGAGLVFPEEEED